MPAGTLRSTTKTHCRCAGSRYRHTVTFSIVVATQPFSPDWSFGTRRKGSSAEPLQSNDPPPYPFLVTCISVETVPVTRSSTTTVNSYCSYLRSNGWNSQENYREPCLHLSNTASNNSNSPTLNYFDSQTGESQGRRRYPRHYNRCRRYNHLGHNDSSPIFSARRGQSSSTTVFSGLTVVRDEETIGKPGELAPPPER